MQETLEIPDYWKFLLGITMLPLRQKLGLSGYEINRHFGFNSGLYVQDDFRCLGM